MLFEIRNTADLDTLREQHCQKAWMHGQPLQVEVITESTGKWGMARLWRAWMKSTADCMAGKGCVMPLMISGSGEQYGERPFNSDDAHELFTSKWLGVDSEGLRLSWAKQPRDGMRPATKGERFLALQKHEAWATEKGISLFNPRGSEYQQLQEAQDK